MKFFRLINRQTRCSQLGTSGLSELDKALENSQYKGILTAQELVRLAAIIEVDPEPKKLAILIDALPEYRRRLVEPPENECYVSVALQEQLELLRPNDAEDQDQKWKDNAFRDLLQLDIVLEYLKKHFDLSNDVVVDAGQNKMTVELFVKICEFQFDRSGMNVWDTLIDRLSSKKSKEEIIAGILHNAAAELKNPRILKDLDQTIKDAVIGHPLRQTGNADRFHKLCDSKNGEEFKKNLDDFVKHISDVSVFTRQKWECGIFIRLIAWLVFAIHDLVVRPSRKKMVHIDDVAEINAKMAILNNFENIGAPGQKPILGKNGEQLRSHWI
jgi:hypothetical protein